MEVAALNASGHWPDLEKVLLPEVPGDIGQSTKKLICFVSYCIAYSTTGNTV
jgi:hypothetical protein